MECPNRAPRPLRAGASRAKTIEYSPTTDSLVRIAAAGLDDGASPMPTPSARHAPAASDMPPRDADPLLHFEDLKHSLTASERCARAAPREQNTLGYAVANTASSHAAVRSDSDASVRVDTGAAVCAVVSETASQNAAVTFAETTRSLSSTVLNNLDVSRSLHYALEVELVRNGVDVAASAGAPSPPLSVALRADMRIAPRDQIELSPTRLWPSLFTSSPSLDSPRFVPDLTTAFERRSSFSTRYSVPPPPPLPPPLPPAPALILPSPPPPPKSPRRGGTPLPPPALILPLTPPPPTSPRRIGTRRLSPLATVVGKTPPTSETVKTSPVVLSPSASLSPTPGAASRKLMTPLPALPAGRALRSMFSNHSSSSLSPTQGASTPATEALPSPPPLERVWGAERNK